MRVLVAGAGGMLAREVVPACERRGHEVVARGEGGMDITDPAQVDEVIASERPEAVINCAGWTDVDGAEDDERGAMRINDEGAGLLAAAAASAGAKVLYPSTDYVFDGGKRSPYVESDMPAPLSAYGRSKLGGETSVAAANPQHLVVRSAWLFGVGGRNFVETMLALGREQPEVLVVSDQVGCPTYAPHLAAAIARLIEGTDYGIHHVAGSGQCSWYEFAQEILDQAGLESRVMAASSDVLARKAKRPSYSVLGSERPEALELPHWRHGLAAYMAERQELLANDSVVPVQGGQRE